MSRDSSNTVASPPPITPHLPPLSAASYCSSAHVEPMSNRIIWGWLVCAPVSVVRPMRLKMATQKYASCSGFVKKDKGRKSVVWRHDASLKHLWRWHRFCGMTWIFTHLSEGRRGVRVPLTEHFQGVKARKSWVPRIRQNYQRRIFLETHIWFGISGITKEAGSLSLHFSLAPEERYDGCYGVITTWINRRTFFYAKCFSYIYLLQVTLSREWKWKKKHKSSISYIKKNTKQKNSRPI